MNSQIYSEKWYVYTLNDPENNKPFYVGKGRHYRMYHHYYNVKKHKIPNGNFRLYNKIKNIIASGKSIEYNIVFSSNDEKEAYDKEHQLIEEIGINNLCNLFSGYGRSYSGNKHWNYGKTTPQSVKDKIGKSKMGDNHTEDAKKKMSEKRKGHLHPMFGHHHTETARKQMSENHADFNGEKNPFYNKSHTNKTKEILHNKLSKPYKIILPNNDQIIIYSIKSVVKYITDYNINNNSNVSAYSLFQYGKNGDGWRLEKF